MHANLTLGDNHRFWPIWETELRPDNKTTLFFIISVSRSLENLNCATIATQKSKRTDVFGWILIEMKVFRVKEGRFYLSINKNSDSQVIK